jgi:hypothetical protein
VKQLTVTFDRPVALAGGALKLFRLNTGGSGANDNSAPTDASAVLGNPVSSEGGKTWTVSFVGGNPFVQLNAGGAFTGSLADGVYTLSVDASKITAGGVPMATNASLTFHRLFGDINGSKTVNNADFGAFRNTFSRSAGQAGFDASFDLDGNGTVSNLDFAQFRNRFGRGYTY